MSASGNWRTGAAIFISSIMAAWVLAWQGGNLINYIEIAFSNPSPALASNAMYIAFSGTGSNVLFLTNFFYLMCLAIPCLGFYLFLQYTFAEQGGDVMGNDQGGKIIYTRPR